MVRLDARAQGDVAVFPLLQGCFIDVAEGVPRPTASRGHENGVRRPGSVRSGV